MSDCRFGVLPVNYPDPDPDPHLCFTIVFICDLFVSRDDLLMS